MEYQLRPAKVYDLGTKKGREDFFTANPWLVKDPHFEVFVPANTKILTNTDKR
jgi:hypothetical protein